MGCLIPEWFGLIRPDLVFGLIRSCLVQSDPVCLACPIADWYGAATASVLHQRLCIGVNVNVDVGRAASSGRCVCAFVGLYVFVEAVWLWYLWSVVSVVWLCVCGRWWIGLWVVWMCGDLVDCVVGGLVCGGWIGAEMCVSRTLVSSNSECRCCVWLVHKF